MGNNESNNGFGKSGKTLTFKEHLTHEIGKIMPMFKKPRYEDSFSNDSEKLEWESLKDKIAGIVQDYIYFSAGLNCKAGNVYEEDRCMELDFIEILLWVMFEAGDMELKGWLDKITWQDFELQWGTEKESICIPCLMEGTDIIKDLEFLLEGSSISICEEYRKYIDDKYNSEIKRSYLYTVNSCGEVANKRKSSFSKYKHVKYFKYVNRRDKKKREYNVLLASICAHSEDVYKKIEADFGNSLFWEELDQKIEYIKNPQDNCIPPWYAGVMNTESKMARAGKFDNV